MGIVRDQPAGAMPDASDYAPTTLADDAGEGMTPEPENDTVDRSSSVVKRGWGAAKQKIQDTKSSSYADDWNPPNGESLLKFLEDDPFAVVGQHWIDEVKEGRRSFNCREDDCPLCACGHKPRALVYFNVVPIQINGEAQAPEVVALKSGPLLEDLIQKGSEDRGGPLSRHFWLLKRWEDGSGAKTKVKYSFAVVKARDLVDDWELDPEVVAQSLVGLELFKPEIIAIPTRAVLEGIVTAHLSDD